MSTELQNQTYNSRILLEEKILADQEIEKERRSLRQENLPPKDSTRLPKDANEQRQRELMKLGVAEYNKKDEKVTL